MFAGGKGRGVNNLRSGRYLVTEPKVVVMGWGGHRPVLSGQGRLLGLGRWAKRGVGVLPTIDLGTRRDVPGLYPGTTRQDVPGLFGESPGTSRD